MTKIILADIQADLPKAWKEAFAGVSNVEVVVGSITSMKAEALVSPANSFGFMNGGIDGVISKLLGWHVQKRVQNRIKHSYDGELLVGQAFTVPTDSEQFPNLVCAPTMRVPENIVGKSNLYLAARAIFLEIKKQEFNTIVIPGLGTGTGGIKAELCAKVMRKAYNDVMGGKAFPDTLSTAWNNHYHETTGVKYVKPEIPS